MKEINFRIIELPTHQVLLQKDFDNDDNDERDLMVITFYLDGVKVKHSYGYENAEIRNRIFDTVKDIQVQKLIDDAISMLLT
jgi:hypothetical protein